MYMWRKYLFQSVLKHWEKREKQLYILNICKSWKLIFDSFQILKNKSKKQPEQL